MDDRSIVARAACLLLATLVAAEAAAQVTLQREPFADLPPAALPDREQPGPRLALRLERSLPVPGPLPGGSPRLAGERVVLEVAGGVVSTDANDPDGPLEVEAGVDAAAFAVADDGEWAYGPERAFRVRIDPDGRVRAERACRRCRSGWRRAWRLRLPGGADLATPSVTATRVFVGALDNRVYALRRRNGHRLWTTDVGDRITRGVAIAEAGRPVLLAVHGDGAKLLALDAGDGQRLSEIELGEAEGEFIGRPLSLPGGRVALARQRYRRDVAALEIYRIESVAAEPAERVSPAPAPDSARTGGGGTAPGGAPLY